MGRPSATSSVSAEPIPRPPRPPSDDFASSKVQAPGYAGSGSTAAFLYPTPNAGTSKASQAFWDVKDVDRTVAALRERGVVFEKYEELPGKRTSDGYVVEAGGAKAAWFKDPDGNILAVIQYVG